MSGSVLPCRVHGPRVPVARRADNESAGLARRVRLPDLCVRPGWTLCGEAKDRARRQRWPKGGKGPLEWNSQRRSRARLARSGARLRNAAATRSRGSRSKLEGMKESHKDCVISQYN